MVRTYIAWGLTPSGNIFASLLGKLWSPHFTWISPPLGVDRLIDDVTMLFIYKCARVWILVFSSLEAPYTE